VRVEVRALDLGPEAAQQVPVPALEATARPGLEAVCAGESAPEPSPAVEVPAPGSSPEVEVPEPPRIPVAAARRARAAITAQVTEDPLTVAAHQAAEQLTKAGKRVTRDALVNALRDAGHTCSNAKGSVLLRQLRESD
jgi:hypothetical protein